MTSASVGSLPVADLLKRIETARTNLVEQLEMDAARTNRIASVQAEAAHLHRSASALTLRHEHDPYVPAPPYKREVKRECPTCAHRWLDKYGKDECPKCLAPLANLQQMHAAGGQPRLPGESSTFKLPPGSAMESVSGICSFGGPHEWRFGRCRKCGMGEGRFASTMRFVPGECERGGRHIFKFTNQCVKCAQHVYDFGDEKAGRRR